MFFYNFWMIADDFLLFYRFVTIVDIVLRFWDDLGWFGEGKMDVTTNFGDLFFDDVFWSLLYGVLVVFGRPRHLI